MIEVTTQAPPMASGSTMPSSLNGFGQDDGGQHHGGDDGHHIGFEQVGGHAGAVADIVADVIGDGGRVARIVFRNAGFDLAHHVAADIGTLGEDAAAETGEDRDQRGAEAEGHQRIDDGAAGGLKAQDLVSTMK